MKTKQLVELEKKQKWKKEKEKERKKERVIMEERKSSRSHNSSLRILKKMWKEKMREQ